MSSWFIANQFQETYLYINNLIFSVTYYFRRGRWPTQNVLWPIVDNYEELNILSLDFIQQDCSKSNNLGTGDQVLAALLDLIAIRY